MFNDNVFPNAGSITGSGGAQITGSGIFFDLDYGLIYPYHVAPYFIHQTGILTSSYQTFNDNSITGSGGAQITGSGIFLVLDYSFPFVNGNLIVTGGGESGIIQAVSPFKPYAFYFRRK